MQQHSIFYVAPDGEVTRLVNDATRANGVILSPDEKTMYSLPAGTTELKAFPVTAPGKLGQGKVFGKLEQPETGKPGGGDGMALDTKGNLYVTRPAMRAIQFMSPEGKTLGVIEFPEFLSNCKFGCKYVKTLYVTTRTSLYAVKMEAAGHRFATGR
jgi:gluconolactonase